MKNVTSLVFTIERNAFLTYRSGITAESKRYVRGLRRTPVRVLSPEKETGTIIKPPKVQREEPVIQKETRGRVSAATTERDAVKQMSDAPAATKHAFIRTKNEVDGLRYERASPGDKRLA